MAGQPAMIEALLRLLAWASAALLALSPDSALAQHRPIAEAMQVEGGGACVDAASLAERVSHWLDRDLIGSEFRVELRLGSGSRASFTLHREDHESAERTFPSLQGNCAERVDALALALAIALDPEAVSRRVEAQAFPGGDEGTAGAEAPEPNERPAGPEEPLEDDGEPRSASGEDAPVGGEVDPATKPTRERRFALALGGGLLWGGLEAAAPFALLAVDIAPHAALRLRIAALLSGARQSVLGTSAYDARLVGGELGVRAGGAFGRWRLEGEAGLTVAAVLAQGQGFGEDLRARRPWVAVTAGPRARVALTEAWAIAVSVQALIALLRARVHAMDPNGSRLATATTPAAGLRLSLEVVARF